MLQNISCSPQLSSDIISHGKSLVHDKSIPVCWCLEPLPAGGRRPFFSSCKALGRTLLSLVRLDAALPAHLHSAPPTFSVAPYFLNFKLASEIRGLLLWLELIHVLVIVPSKVWAQSLVLVDSVPKLLLHLHQQLVQSDLSFHLVSCWHGIMNLTFISRVSVLLHWVPHAEVWSFHCCFDALLGNMTFFPHFQPVISLGQWPTAHGDSTRVFVDPTPLEILGWQPPVAHVVPSSSHTCCLACPCQIIIFLTCMYAYDDTVLNRQI